MYKKTINNCHICKETSIEILSKFEGFNLVTSDSKNWHSKHSIGICSACGVVQKSVDDFYKKQINEVYSNYSLYYQGNGSEQVVFTEGTGSGCQRSEVLVSHLNSFLKSKSGKLLDVGCGNGAFLKAFSKVYKFWQLTGMDINTAQQSEIEKINNTKFICGDISKINNSYDLVSVIHVLEHVIDPLDFLRSLKKILNDDGTLLIEVPYFEKNSFDLLIVDHCTHFDLNSMVMMLTLSGFEILKITTDWVHKEMTVLAKLGNDNVQEVNNIVNIKRANTLEINKHIDWLSEVIIFAKNIAKLGSGFGVFGTAIAATWLAKELDEQVDFFVDEDSTRIGTTHLGKPVYHPENIPSNSHVFISLPYETAKLIQQKYNTIYYHLPPVLKV